jgi:S1-C subfamily serine protease
MRAFVFVAWLALLSAPLRADGSIGVIFMEEPTPGTLWFFGHTDEGLLIIDLVKEGPAAKSGIAKYDVITAIGGASTATLDDVQRIVLPLEPGSRTKVALRRRNGDDVDELEIDCGVGDRDELLKKYVADQQAESETESQERKETERRP